MTSIPRPDDNLMSRIRELRVCPVPQQWHHISAGIKFYFMGGKWRRMRALTAVMVVNGKGKDRQI